MRYVDFLDWNYGIDIMLGLNIIVLCNMILFKLRKKKGKKKEDKMSFFVEFFYFYVDIDCMVFIFIVLFGF